MLRNRRGATSLRWLRALLDHGIEVHGQVVRVPRRQRRRRARRHAGRRARRVPRAGLGRRRAARGQPVQHRGRRCARTRRPRRPPSSTPSRTWQARLPRARSAAAWCSPPTSTTCWPAARSPPPRPTRASRMHEDGIGMARTFELEFARRRADTHRRRRAASSPGSTAPRPPATGPPRNPAGDTGLHASRQRRTRG